MVKVTIVNVVATASVGKALDFNELGKFKEIIYNSNTYRGQVAYFKTKKMAGKVSMFRTGKLISVGTKSEPQAFKELEMAKTFLARKNLIENVELIKTTQNIVVLADFQTTLNLERLCEGEKTIYEPEQFPGAILRLETPNKSSILIFASGKTIITGLKESNQIEQVIQKLQGLIELNQ
ncbi:MAG: hypothetical protein NWE92_01655 [Candidatus Bathyarchaeota archaeon]|nr:hypothetical protein [Candidatus Bathyarchaeota archaeon]